MSDTVTCNEFNSELLDVLGRIVSTKKWSLGQIKIKLELAKVVGNVEDRIVVCWIFKIYEQVFTVGVFYQYVVRKKIVVGKTKILLFERMHSLPDELDLLGIHPLFENLDQLLLSFWVNVLGHFLPYDFQQLLSLFKEYRTKQRFSLDFLRFTHGMKLLQSEGYIFYGLRREHILTL